MTNLIRSSILICIIQASVSVFGNAQDSIDINNGIDTTALESSIWEMNSVFYNLSDAYIYLDSTLSENENLQAHRDALHTYLPAILLVNKDTDAAAEYVRKNGADSLPPDLFERFEGEDVSDYSPESLDEITVNMEILMQANSSSPLVEILLTEIAFQLTMDESYYAYQAALNSFREMEPRIREEITRLSAESANKDAAADLALDLISFAFDLCRNSKVIEYYGEYGELVKSKNDIDSIERGFNAFIHAYTVSGDLETADRLRAERDMAIYRLREEENSRAKQESAKAVIYQKSVITEFDPDFIMADLMAPSEDMIAASSMMDINTYHLEVSNISQLQFEYLQQELLNVFGVDGVSDSSYENNTGKLRITSIHGDPQILAAALAEHDFSDFVLGVDSVSEDNSIFATATGKPTEKFNVMLPVFEYIRRPEEDFDSSVLKTLLSRTGKAKGVEQDLFRKIIYLNFEVMIGRMTGSYDNPAKTPSLPGDILSAFPYLSALYLGQECLALMDSGMYGSAVSLIETARKIISGNAVAAKSFPMLTRRTMENSFVTLLSAGDVDAAAENAQLLDRLIDTADDAMERVNLTLASANLKYLRGEYEEAETMFESARAALENYGDTDEIRALIDLGIGNCRIMRLDHAGAEEYFESAARLAEDSGVMLLAAQALSHLAHVRLFTGKYELSKEAAQRALELAEGFSNSELQWQAQYTLGRALEALGSTDKALDAYMAALDIIELKGYSTGSENGSTSADARNVYRYAFSLCARLNKPETALRILELDNALSLRDEFEKGNVKFQNPQREEAVSRVNELRRDIDSTEKSIASQAGASDTESGSAAVDKLKDDLREKQREYIKYVSGLGRDNRGIASLYKIEPVELVRIRENLPKDMAVLYYLLGEKNLYIFFVRSDSIGFRQIEIDADTLANMVTMFRLSCSEPHRAAAVGEIEPGTLLPAAGGDSRELDRLKRNSNKLYTTLIAPMAADLEGINSIAIIPNGIFHFVPFQALLDSEENGKFLVEKFAVFYVDTLSVFEKAGSPANMSEIPLYAFGNADDSLPSAEKEVDTISSLFSKASIYVKQQASEAKAKEVSEHVGVYHFATHGVLDYRSIAQSYILLATGAGSEEDGKFTVEEVWGYWWGDSVLVVLSACNTAMGELEARGKAVHPAGAFLNAGAPSVLATLWSVDDEATSSLMKYFYTGLDNNTSKIEALRNAQLELLKSPKTVHPFFWAPFNLIGDWR